MTLVWLREVAQWAKQRTNRVRTVPPEVHAWNNNTKKHHEVLCYASLLVTSLFLYGLKLRVAVRKAFTRIERGCMASLQSPSSQYLLGRETHRCWVWSHFLADSTHLGGDVCIDETTDCSFSELVTLQSVNKVNFRTSVSEHRNNLATFLSNRPWLTILFPPRSLNFAEAQVHVNFDKFRGGMIYDASTQSNGSHSLGHLARMDVVSSIITSELPSTKQRGLQIADALSSESLSSS